MSAVVAASDNMRPTGSFTENKENLMHFGAWVLVTIVLVGITYGAARPDFCRDSKVCKGFHGEGYGGVNEFAMCALTTALVMEFSSVALTWRSAQGLVGIVRGIEYTFIPPLLLCIALVMLILENLTLTELFFVHVAADGVGGDSGRPVYSAIIFEWLVNVPILMVLSGNFALNRPMSEVSRPLLVTNIYIVISWAAYFIPIEPVRWVFIAIAFIMYAWASYDMANWVFHFRASARRDLPSRTLRCALTIGLIIVFFIYGMVFLASFLDFISSKDELIFYITWNFGVKLTFLISFVGIRSSQFYDLLVTLIANKVLPFERQVMIPGDVDNQNYPTDALPLVE